MWKTIEAMGKHDPMMRLFYTVCNEWWKIYQVIVLTTIFGRSQKK